MKKSLLTAVAAMAIACSATSANAAVFLFTIGTSYGSGSGTITTATNNPGFNLITGLTGTFDGGAITLLAPGTYPSSAPNDNLFSSTNPYFTFGGLSFSANALNYNLYNSGSLRICGETSGCQNGTVTSFTVTAANAVPEPATWAMMIGGLGVVGLAMRRRRTTVSFA